MLGLRPGAVLGLVRELRAGAGEEGPLCVAGAPALAAALRRELAEGAAPGSVREGFDPSAAALVYVLAAAPVAEDEQALRAAARAGLPVVVVLAGPRLDPRVPGVPATAVVAVDSASGFPLEEIADALARQLGERGTGLSARAPALRAAVCRHLIAHFALRNGILGAAVFLRGADFPVMTLNQIRLVLRIGAAHGVEIDAQRAPEALGVVGAGAALRKASRRAVRAVPAGGWAIRGGIAYAGTRAIGEAAVRYFDARARESVRSGS